MKRPTKGIAVDCGCIGNPGKAEYRGIDIATGKILFEHKIDGLCTNNIAEFAALVEGVKYLISHTASKNFYGCKVYSDSKIALSWYKTRKPNCSLFIGEKTREAWNLLIQSVELIPVSHSMNYVDFWSNKIFGEIPADYGRKNKKQTLNK